MAEQEDRQQHHPLHHCDHPIHWIHMPDPCCEQQGRRLFTPTVSFHAVRSHSQLPVPMSGCGTEWVASKERRKRVTWTRQAVDEARRQDPTKIPVSGSC